MRYWLIIGILAIVMINEYRKYKYVLCATVVYPVPWIFSLYAISISNFYDVSYSTLSIIVLGYLLFCFAFRFFSSPISIINSVKKMNFDISKHWDSLNIVFLFSIIVGSIYLYFMRSQFSLLAFSQSFRELYRADLGIGFFVYFSYIPKCTLWFFSILFGLLLNPYNNQKYKRYRFNFICKYLILLFFNIIICIPGFSRTMLLYTFTPAIINFFVAKGLKNKNVLLFFLFGIISFMGLFISFSMLKHQYLYLGKDIKEIALNQILAYMGGGIVAFDQLRQTIGIDWISLNGGGVYTFRGLLGLFDRLLETHYAQPILQDFIIISSSFARTNVYTVYEWASKDFGVLYSILLQLVYGFIYGTLYKGIGRGKIMSLYWYSALFYPLVIMFFQDQYSALGAVWIIVYVSTLIIIKISQIKLKIIING